MEENQIQAVDNTQKKKSPVLTIILVIIALAGTGFGVYGMFFNKSTDTPKCPAVAACDNSETATGNVGDAGEKDEDYALFYELIRKYIDHDAYEYNFEKYGFEDKNYMAEVAARELRSTNFEDISAHDLNEKILELFNYDFSNIEEVRFLCRTYNLTEKGLYHAVGGGCGGGGNTSSLFEINNIERDDDTLTIGITYTNIYFGPPDEDGDTIVLNDKNGQKIFGQSYEGEYGSPLMNEGIKLTKQSFEENLDLFQKYQLNFKKVNKRYYLESGKKID